MKELWVLLYILLVQLLQSGWSNAGKRPMKIEELSPAVAQGAMMVKGIGPSSHLISANSAMLPDSLLWKPRSRRAAPVVDSDADQGTLSDTSNSDFNNVDLPKLLNIQADCVNPQFIKVSLEFDREFQGIVYTKGHFMDENCLYAHEGSGFTKLNFTIATDTCGTLDKNLAAEVNASITEATVIIQNDPLFQDANDVARRIRCAWSDRFDKIISSRGFKVGSLSENTMDYSADAVSVWMDLRMGKDPFQGTPVTNGVVRLGSDMTVAIYMKSKIDRGLDVVIRDCVANDAKKHQQIQLTDENGCVIQKKLMTPFTVTDHVGQSGASRIAFAQLKSFKFPDSLDVNIICNVAMCKGPCGITCPTDAAAKTATNSKANTTAKPSAVRQVVSNKRQKRDVSDHTTADDHDHDLDRANDVLLGKTVFLKDKGNTEVVLERGIRVLSDNDITEVLVGNQNNRSYDVLATVVKNNDYVCVPKTGFGIGLAILLLIILILSIISVFLCCAACARRGKKEKTIKTSSINLYNSTEQLNKSSPTHSLVPPSSSGLTRGSAQNVSVPDYRGSVLSTPRLSSNADFKASAITLPGVDLNNINSHVRQSTMSLNMPLGLHSDTSFFSGMVLPVGPPSDLASQLEQARSLRSVTVRDRPRSVADTIDDKKEGDEATRSLRSFTLRSEAPTAKNTFNDETARSLRSFTVRSDRRATLTGVPIDIDETARSMRSTLRSVSHGSDHSDQSSEHPRSEGTARTGSQTSLVHNGSQMEEQPRSMRSVSYRN